MQRSSLLILKRLILRNLAHRPLYAWYRFVVAKRILNTRPVACGADTAYELHTLTCEHDLLNTLWSLKTWYHYSNTRPALVIYAGGPLSDHRGPHPLRAFPELPHHPAQTVQQ